MGCASLHCTCHFTSSCLGVQVLLAPSDVRDSRTHIDRTAVSHQPYRAPSRAAKRNLAPRAPPPLAALGRGPLQAGRPLRRRRGRWHAPPIMATEPPEAITRERARKPMVRRARGRRPVQRGARPLHRPRRWAGTPSSPWRSQPLRWTPPAGPPPPPLAPSSPVPRARTPCPARPQPLPHPPACRSMRMNTRPAPS